MLASKKRFVGIAIVVVAAGIFNSSWISFSPSFRQRLSAWYVGGEYEGNEGVLMQTRYNNCGPTALQMVFDYYKIPSTVDEIEQKVGLTEKGTTMLALKEIAELKGLHAEGWRLTLKDFMNSSFPLLLFVRHDHFVVADSICNHIVFLRDPAIGKVKIPTRKLSKIWQGEALVFNEK
jgi:ABC-type bacteriocin/lantibiotic exporter with double-glycine peptidase domain